MNERVLRCPIVVPRELTCGHTFDMFVDGMSKCPICECNREISHTLTTTQILQNVTEEYHMNGNDEESDESDGDGLIDWDENDVGNYSHGHVETDSVDDQSTEDIEVSDNNDCSVSYSTGSLDVFIVNSNNSNTCEGIDTNSSDSDLKCLVRESRNFCLHGSYTCSHHYHK
jgi:hypothetical protein